MSRAPVVTGVSPKDGPPGTRITIRGENLGYSASDVTCLTICECDCTLSAEWKSPNKIIARSGIGKGTGEIIVTTRGGGRGTCLVKFRGYTESIGPTKESAVWVDQPATLSWARRSLSPASYHQEDPLGLSVEESDKSVPEDDLNDMFPGQCSDLGSENFSPGWFLLENHVSTNFEDLKAGLAHMKRNIDNQKRGELSFLKANVSSVVDQLDTLNKLKGKYETDCKELPDFTSRAVRRIEETKEQAYALFEEVLARREKADTTRNGLAVLQRFKFLFCLPSSIDQNFEKAEYDVIINEYSRVKHMFGNTEIELFKKVLAQVETQIDRVRSALLTKLETSPLQTSSLDEYTNIITSLIHLDAREDVAWLGIVSFANHLEQAMLQLNDKYIVLETSDVSRRDRSAVKTNALASKPHRVVFVEQVIELMELRFPELWKLGQAYFRGDFQVEETENPGKLKLLVMSCINTLCNVVRSALLPRTPGRHAHGTWPSTGYDAVQVWLAHCLRAARTCYSCFTRIDLPSDALSVFSQLVQELRLLIVTSLLRTAAEEISSLAENEDWTIEEHAVYGGVSKLPQKWDAVVRRAVASAHDVALASGPREAPLMDSPQAQKEAMAALEALFTSFAATMEATGSSGKMEQRGAVVSQLIGTGELPLARGSDSDAAHVRLLITYCNAQYTLHVFLPQIFPFIQECGLPCSSETQKRLTQVFSAVSNRLLDQFLEYKCDPLVSTIEPSMYLTMFDWANCPTPTGIRAYAQEVIINTIGVRSELHRVPLATVKCIMTRIVETVSEELARLLTRVKQFSPNGAVQATADTLAIREATRAYSSSKSAKFFGMALSAAPGLSKEQEQMVSVVLADFRSRMALQLLCLNDK